jgi:ribosomal protein S18 acetylase RimI-like enzyme
MKDIVIEAGSGRLHFKWLEWDTAFFGRPSCILDWERSHWRASPDWEQALRESLRGTFATVRVDSAADPALLLMLQSCGFYYVDTSVTLRYDDQAAAAPLPDDACVKVQELRENQGLPYEELGSVFTMTRFHFDPQVGQERAAKLWIEYIRNFRPGGANRLFAAFCEGRTAGVMTMVGRGEALVLSFVSVLAAQRGRQVGARLLREIIARRGGKELLTETQVRNVGAINFYLKNGFRQVQTTRTVLHRWG